MYITVFHDHGIRVRRQRHIKPKLTMESRKSWSVPTECDRYSVLLGFGSKNDHPMKGSQRR